MTRNGRWRATIDIPAWKSAGPLVCTSAILGFDEVTKALPADPAEQFRNAFANLDRVFSQAGIAAEEIGLLQIDIPERAMREFIDALWLERFPDPARRPARKTNEFPLPTGVFVQLQAVALRSAQVLSVEIPGLSHRSPLPMGSRLGSLVFSSVIGGDDPATGELPETPEHQIRLAFENAKQLMEQAGGDAQGINHLWVFPADMKLNQTMLDAYLSAFPDSSNRPARKTIPIAMPEGLFVQIQLTGHIAGRSANYELPGVAHHDPIPLASRAGSLFQSSGIHGIDPECGEMTPDGLDAECALALGHVEQAIGKAGGSLSSIAAMTVMLRSFEDISPTLGHLQDLFGEHGLPALRFVNYPLPADLLVQFHVTGWVN